MNLDQTAAVIRPRPPWEAVDLGFAMARTWRRSILVAWSTTVVPLWVVVLILLGRHPGWCFLVLWWLKPLYDVPVLSVLSRSLFGASPGWRETVVTTWSTWWRQAHRLLLLRRLDPSRSFFLPVLLLEGLRGRPLRERSRLLARQSVLRDTSALTVALALLESCALLGAVGAVSMLQPSSIRNVWTLVGEALAGEGPLWFLLCAIGVWLLTVALLEPCYVAAGFCLYLNRRTLLEGWDVELGLRRLGSRLGRRRRRVPSVAAVVLVVFSLAALESGLPAAAQTEYIPEPTSISARRDPAAVAAEVLSHEDFGSLEEIETWRLKYRREAKVRDRTVLFPSWIASLIELVLWALAVIGVLWLVVKLLPRFDRPKRRDEKDADRAEVVSPDYHALRAGTDLPEDVPAAALAELAAGRSMMALSLLYRGTLSALAQGRRLEIHESWTEDQCLARVASRLPEVPAKYLHEVTLAWQSAAYGHALPIDDAVRDLCYRWAPELAAR